MGMDVYGINPADDDGDYFRANVWSWRPILSMIELANEMAGKTLLDQETLDSMGHNDGAGLNTQGECEFLAQLLQQLVTPKNLSDAGFVVDGEEINYPIWDKEKDLVTDAEGLLKRADEVDDLENYKSAYGTTFDHVKQFIKFLRSCGGFEVR